MTRVVVETRFRRFMMQGIMWIILGATLVAAALVNKSKERSLNVELGDPIQLQGCSVRVPQDWVALDAAENSPNRLIRIDQEFGRQLVITITQTNFLDRFRPQGAPGDPKGQIPIAGITAQLFFIADPDRGDLLRVATDLPNADRLTISLRTDIRDAKDFARQKDLIKRVAESVKVGQ